MGSGCESHLRSVPRSLTEAEAIGSHPPKVVAVTEVARDDDDKRSNSRLSTATVKWRNH